MVPRLRTDVQQEDLDVEITQGWRRQPPLCPPTEFVDDDLQGDSHKFKDALRDINFDTEVQFECIELDNSETIHDTTLTRKILPSDIPPASTVKVQRVLTVYDDGDKTDPGGKYRIHYTGKG